MDMGRRGTAYLVAAAGLAVAAAVWTPVATADWFVRLDFVVGPETRLSEALFSGRSTSLLTELLAVGLVRILGAAGSWLFPALAMCCAVGAMAWLVRGPAVRWLPAALLFAVNPLMYERFYAGQFAYVAAYALVPLGLGLLMRARWAPAALAIAVMAALTPHAAWMMAVVGIGVLAAHRSVRSVKGAGAAFIAAVVPLAYLVPGLLGVGAPGDGSLARSASELVAFRTLGDRIVGLFGNVAGLYGFWRGSPGLPKEYLAGWPLLLAAILLVGGAGGQTMLRGSQRRLALALLVIGAAGYFLALGDQGPTGPPYRWLYDNLPGFAVMREPQKFLGLAAMAYAVFFGFGVERMVGAARSAGGRRALAAVGVLLPLAYTPTLLWGLAGKVTGVEFPASYAEADRAMGEGDGLILALPWHQYLSFPWAGTVIANPAGSVFAREAVVSEDPEKPGVGPGVRTERGSYLSWLMSQGPKLCAFGDLMAPIGVEYVVLYKTVDWAGYREWLDRQVDLEVVMDADDLVLYRNLRYRGLMWQAADEVAEVDDWRGLVALSREGLVSRRAVRVKEDEPGGDVPSGEGECAAVASAPPSGLSTRHTRVAHAYAGATVGAPLVLGEPWDEEWRAGNLRVGRASGGVIAVEARGEAGSVRFSRWPLHRATYVVSVLGFTGLAVISLRRRSRTDADTDTPFQLNIDESWRIRSESRRGEWRVEGCGDPPGDPRPPR